MARRVDIETKTEELVLPIIKANNFELVDVEYVKEGANWYLRVYAGKEGGIAIDDCVLISRSLEEKLDAEDFIEDAYILEVSSPGLGRPLKKEKDYVSGQELCESLGVSRTAVWKAIRQLEEQGYVIEAVRNKGYRLVEEADVLTVAELHSVLDTKWLGKELEYYYETDSTNNRARDAAEKGASHGFLAVADCQTAGKGRRGRVWNSPHGTDIYMSFVLRPTFTPSQASMLTLVAGMAVVKGVQKATGLSAMIKWPNDAVVNGKKICGILTEMSTEEDAIRYVVPGIGINVNATEFPEEIRDKATSLKLELGRSVKRSDVICAVAESFEEYYEIFEKTCDMSGLLSAYDEMLVNMEKTVCVLDPKGEYRGKALGIDEEGCLLVEKENGEVVHVLSGEVSVRGIYGYV